jgi:Bifunctional DNA primase/polymerase, N-terminal
MLLLEDRRLPCFYVTPAKVPFAGSHAYLDATADPVQLAKLAERFRGPKLVAVATGAISGIDIVDIDPRHGGDRWYFEHIDRLGKTRAHETRGGGWHLIYKHSPSLRNSNKLAPGVEFLSSGRWAVWWAAHACRVLCEGPVAPLPGWLHEALLTIPGDIATRKEIRPSTLKPGSDLQATGSTLLRSKYLILALERCPSGNRHNMLHWTACRFGNMIGEGKIITKVANIC